MVVAKSRSLLVAVIALAALACSRSGGKGDVTIAGSTSVQPFAEKWVEAYRKTHPGVAIHVQGGGSTAGVAAAQSGAAQIGMCSRELKPDEAQKLKGIVVAMDGLTIIVHPANPLADIKPEQVRGIFTGEITTWRGVGGSERSIHAVTRENGSGARGAFEELVMKGKPIASSALVQDSQGAVRQMVSTDPDAIGYVSHGVVDASVRGLRIAGAQPSEATVADHSYPLVRPFYFLVKGEPTPPAKEFIDWVLGPEGQAIARKEGLFAVK